MAMHQTQSRNWIEISKLRPLPRPAEQIPVSHWGQGMGLHRKMLGDKYRKIKKADSMSRSGTERVTMEYTA
jgi:hypothetical protein